MSTEPLAKTPSERADRLATNVHTLWGRHRRRFAEMLKAADKEARAYLQKKAADDVAERKNRRAVLAEWQALQTKKGKPCLTDPQKQPGPDADWCWNASTHVPWMDQDGKGETVTILAWYRRRRAVAPLNFESPVVAKNPSMAMRYAALAAAHDQVWPAKDGKIGSDAPLAAVLDILRGGRFYGNLCVRIQDIPNGPGFDEGGMDRLEAFYKTVKADLAIHQIQPGGGASENAKKQQPWNADAVEYLSLKEAVKLFDGCISLRSLSGYMRPTGEMRYMRKGQRCRVHIGDLRQFMQARQADPKWARAYLTWLSAAGKGGVRFYWRCKVCGYEFPEGASAMSTCPKPKCPGECEIFRKPPPEPKR